MNRRLSVVVLALATVVVLAIKWAPAADREKLDLKSLSDSDLKTMSLRFERSRCYGSCPSYSITVQGDGTVEYVGKDNVKTKGSQKANVDAATLRKLASEFAKADFFSLADFSEENCKGTVCTDMPTVTTELSLKSETRKMTHYYGCRTAPKALWDLESALDKLLNTEQWTGDVSKQGPFGTTCFNH